jgi:hypothetical protein
MAEGDTIVLTALHFDAAGEVLSGRSALVELA